MNTASCEKEAPSLSRDEAIAILDTPDEELEALIDRASSLRQWNDMTGHSRHNPGNSYRCGHW